MRLPAGQSRIQLMSQAWYTLTLYLTYNIRQWGQQHGHDFVIHFVAFKSLMLSVIEYFQNTIFNEWILFWL